MARYIDADLLMKELRDFVRPSNNSDFANVPTWNDAVSLVGSAPTADVRENVHAHWFYDEAYTCSNCGYSPKYFKRWNMNFCPNCGAQMGERRAEDA